MCRKHHGTPFGTGVGVTDARFRWLTATDAVVPFRATPAFERPFCRGCGATVPGRSHVPDVWHVPAGLLERIDEKPRTHIFTASKAAFHTITDSLPRFAAYPPGVTLPSVPDPARSTEAGRLTGSCLCGAIAYVSDAVPRHTVNCYCSRCRRSRGTAHNSTLPCPASGFRFTRGEELLGHYALPQAARYRTAWCTCCGSVMPTITASFDLALLPAGSLDTPLAPLTAVHIHVASMASWFTVTDDGEQFAELPPAERLVELLA